MDIGTEQPARHYEPKTVPVPQREEQPTRRTVPTRAPEETPTETPVKTPAAPTKDRI